MFHFKETTRIKMNQNDILSTVKHNAAEVAVLTVLCLQPKASLRLAGSFSSKHDAKICFGSHKDFSSYYAATVSDSRIQVRGLTQTPAGISANAEMISMENEWNPKVRAGKYKGRLK
jgi:hypothetical protein